MTQEDLEAG